MGHHDPYSGYPSLSLAVVLLLFSTYAGRIAIGPASHERLLEAVKISFAVSDVLCFLGAFASAARGKAHRERPQG